MSVSFKVATALGFILAIPLFAVPALGAPAHETGYRPAHHRVAEFAAATALVKPAAPIAEEDGWPQPQGRGLQQGRLHRPLMGRSRILGPTRQSAGGEDSPVALRSVGPSKPGGRHFLDETEIRCYTRFYSRNLAFGAVGRQKGENVRLRSLAQRLRPEENFLFGFSVTH
jgi:hypothetical protein